MYKRFGKRLLDVVIAILSLSVLAPIIGLVALLVRAHLGRPVIFRQLRPGQNKKPLTLYKFRTMMDSRDSRGQLLIDAERLTPFGRFLRATSLDELPELFNVVRGEMSLVGPRPLLMEYLKRYSGEETRRHEVRPGITGLTQVKGRNAITWEEKFALDVWYVDHLSFWLDMKIIALTMWKIINREGINHPGQATMEVFQGRGSKHEG